MKKTKLLPGMWTSSLYIRCPYCLKENYRYLKRKKRSKCNGCGKMFNHPCPDGNCICVEEPLELCPVCHAEKEKGQFCDNCDGRKMD